MIDGNLEKTTLRVKIDNISTLIKKLGNIFKQIETDKTVYIAGPEIVNHLFGLATSLEELESIDDKGGEVFASFLKNLTTIIQDIGALPGWQTKYSEDEYIMIISILRNLEGQSKDIMKIVITIDDSDKKSNYETFGGLLQKLFDAIQEKIYILAREIK